MLAHPGPASIGAPSAEGARVAGAGPEVLRQAVPAKPTQEATL